MANISSLVAAAVLYAIATQAFAQNEGFQPVTSDVLANPPAGDWLMINRTYDEQRFSPLDQINKRNADQLQMAWSRGLPIGTNETTPIVHQGVMYAVNPGGGVIAINATNGDLIWEYERQYPKEMADFVGDPQRARSKGLAIYEDMIYFLAHDGASSPSTPRPGRSAGSMSSRISRSSHRPPRHRSLSMAR
jgi:alcohol dehydrogenase (cytochrome c)